MWDFSVIEEENGIDSSEKNDFFKLVRSDESLNTQSYVFNKMAKILAPKLWHELHLAFDNNSWSLLGWYALWKMQYFIWLQAIRNNHFSELEQLALHKLKDEWSKYLSYEHMPNKDSLIQLLWDVKVASYMIPTSHDVQDELIHNDSWSEVLDINGDRIPGRINSDLSYIQRNLQNNA